jgi:hypothetical protein
MARRKDIAGLAALGALGMMLNRQGESKGPSPVYDLDTRASTETASPDISTMGRDENYGNEGRRTSPVGIGKVPSRPAVKRVANPTSNLSTRSDPDAPEVQPVQQSNQRRLNSAEALAQLDRQTGVKPMDPNADRGPNAVTSTELSRNASAIMNGMGPGKLVTGLSLAARENMANKAAQKAYNQRAAMRRADEGLNADEAAIVQDRIHRASFDGGMKKGGKVKKMASSGSTKVSASSRGDGIAMRGKTRGMMR